MKFKAKTCKKQKVWTHTRNDLVPHQFRILKKISSFFSFFFSFTATNKSEILKLLSQNLHSTRENYRQKPALLFGSHGRCLIMSHRAKKAQLHDKLVSRRTQEFR